MAREWRTFDHTADIGVEAAADTLAELFEAMAEAIADLICPTSRVAPNDERRIAVQAEDVEALAVDFLTAVMIAIETDGFAVASVRVRRIDETSLEAALAGEPLDPARHELHTEVKAVTYHQLRVAREGDRWVGRVILDV